MRHLPVLQNEARDDVAAGRRPPWQWTLITAGFTVTLWIPLTLLTAWLGRRLAGKLVDVSDPHALARFMSSAAAGGRAELLALLVGPIALSFVAASLAAGALVGRFAGRPGNREAALGGFLAAVCVWGVAVLGGALSPWPLALGSIAALGLLGAAFTWLGSQLGRKRRR